MSSFSNHLARSTNQLVGVPIYSTGDLAGKNASASWHWQAVSWFILSPLWLLKSSAMLVMVVVQLAVLPLACSYHLYRSRCCKTTSNVAKKSRLVPSDTVPSKARSLPSRRLDYFGRVTGQPIAWLTTLGQIMRFYRPTLDEVILQQLGAQNQLGQQQINHIVRHATWYPQVWAKLRAVQVRLVMLQKSSEMCHDRQAIMQKAYELNLASKKLVDCHVVDQFT